MFPRLRLVPYLLTLLLITTPAWGQDDGASSPAPAPESRPAVEAETGVPEASPPAEEEPADAAPLDSPRAVMKAFLEGFRDLRRTGDADAWDRILATLQPPPNMTPEHQREAAAAILESLDKLGTVDETDLPGEVEVRLSGATRYTYFPGSADQAWVWSELKSFGQWPAGRIELVQVAPSQWRFAQSTVAQATALAESLRPLPPKHFAALAEDEKVTDASKVVGLLGPTFTFTPWWAWLTLLGLIFAGLTLGRIAKSLLQKIADQRRRSGWLLSAVGAEALRNPVSFVLLTVGLNAGLVLFIHLGDTAPFVFAVVQFLYLIAIGWAMWNLVAIVEMALARATAHTANRIDDMVVPLVRRSLRIFLVVLFTLFVAQNVFGLNITGWLAGLGIAGLAVSLAAQDSVKNLFGWATVLFDRPFTVGDFINVGGTLGTVEDIGFRSTKVRMLSGAVYTIPNMKWIDGTVENIAARGSIRRDLNLSLPFDTPPDKVDEAVRIVEDILLHDAEVVNDLRYDPEKQRPQVHFDDIKGDSLNLKVYYWYAFGGDASRNYNAWLRNSQIINLKILRRFREAGINLAFPSRTIVLANDETQELAVRVLGADTPRG